MSARTVNVLSCELAAKGEKNGREWFIYEVTALNDKGEHIDLPLRSFEELSPGEHVVDVEKYTRPNGETTYTLKKPGSGGGGGGSPSPGARLGPKVDDLRTRVEGLERQVGWLLEQVNGLIAVAHDRGAELPKSSTIKPEDYGKPPAGEGAMF